MKRAIHTIVLFAFLAFTVSSCITIDRQCKVKSKKAKWKHYNSLQFGKKH